MTTTGSRVPAYVQRVLDLAQHDPQLQQLRPDPVVLGAVSAEQPLLDIVTTILDGYGPRPALGTRAYDVVADPTSGRSVRRLLPRFDTITYAQLHGRVRSIAAALRSDPCRLEPGEFVCTLGFAGVDYTAFDLAALLNGAVAVPLQTTLGGIDLDRIISDTEPVVIAAEPDDLVIAAELAARHAGVRLVVAMDVDGRVDDDRERVEAARATLAGAGRPVALVTIDELVAASSPGDWQPPEIDDADDRMVMLIHSSGSTGRPKGVIIDAKYAKSQFTTTVPIPIPVVRLCFAPMNHAMGRGTVYTTLARGGTASFTARPDMSTLLEDFALVRPTESVMFPRVFEMIHRHYLAEVARLEAAGSEPDPRAAAIATMRSTVLGDRISFILSGSAPTPPEVRQFVLDCFPVTLADAYSTTEAGAAVTVRNRVSRPYVIDYRLRDVPELGYYVSDKPFPRGELCVKTQMATRGYFKNPEATAGLFDDEGFLRTGDIMEERGPDHLVYIDRRNDVVKLAQGEFVALGALGNRFEEHSDVIRQIHVHADASRAYLLAVVVPDPTVAEATLGEGFDDEALRSLIRSEVRRVAASEGLRPFEVPRDFIVEPEPFTHENGMLSSVQKRMRPNIQRRYGEALDRLYAEIERRQNDELAAMRDPNSPLTPVEKMRRAIEVTLGRDDIDVTRPASFAELGGDSLGAVALASLLSDVFGVEVPVNTILSPATSPVQWLDAILSDERAAPHRMRHAGHLDADDLTSERLLGGERTICSVGGGGNDVLVTGATGFLGRFLCLEWLERAAGAGGTVHCFVRAVDHGGAMRRLRAAYASDPVLLHRFDQLADAHLRIVVGDVAEPLLGLDRRDYDALAERLGRIVHPAALVNHVFAYDELFAPNVVGTAELVALGLHAGIECFDFVSSLAVAPLLDRDGGAAEDWPLRERIKLDAGYTAGYGASKWAAEQVLHAASRQSGLAVNIFRGDMMLPHREFVGQINAPDIFIRLLSSVVTTGLAPDSFYELDADGGRRAAHFDGLPVDFIAASMVDISARPANGVSTYHVVNPHGDDEVSLDTIVGWIEADGVVIERLDHATWIGRFEERLRALPGDRRSQSALGILDWLRRPMTPSLRTIGCERFVAANALAAGEPQIPHIDRALISKCLRDMRELDLIDTAAAALG